MIKYTLKRIGMALLTLLIITFLLFVLVRIMPGNPFPSERMSAEQIQNKRAEMGLDDPILTQFIRYMENVMHGDFGKGTSEHGYLQFLPHRRHSDTAGFAGGTAAGNYGCTEPGKIPGRILYRILNPGRMRAELRIPDFSSVYVLL